MIRWLLRLFRRRAWPTGERLPGFFIDSTKRG